LDKQERITEILISREPGSVKDDSLSDNTNYGNVGETRIDAAV